MLHISFAITNQQINAIYQFFSQNYQIVLILAHFIQHFLQLINKQWKIDRPF
jgi:hypothetical protein